MKFQKAEESQCEPYHRKRKRKQEEKKQEAPP